MKDKYCCLMTHFIGEQMDGEQVCHHLSRQESNRSI